LDRPIEIVVAGARNAVLKGRAADGREVSVSVDALPAGEQPVRFGVLFDRSGSTANRIDGAGDASVWSAATNALAVAVTNSLDDGDTMSLWQFDNSVEFLGEAMGRGAAALIGNIGKPQGGTAIGAALQAPMAAPALSTFNLSRRAASASRRSSSAPTAWRR
jgi:hypothetical protein